MKSILTLSICLLVSFQSFSQTILAQAKQGDVWGYINQKGEFVIKKLGNNRVDIEVLDSRFVLDNQGNLTEVNRAGKQLDMHINWNRKVFEIEE